MTRGLMNADAEAYGADKLWVLLKPILIELDDEELRTTTAAAALHRRLTVNESLRHRVTEKADVDDRYTTLHDRYTLRRGTCKILHFTVNFTVKQNVKRIDRFTVKSRSLRTSACPMSVDRAHLCAVDAD